MHILKCEYVPCSDYSYHSKRDHGQDWSGVQSVREENGRVQVITSGKWEREILGVGEARAKYRRRWEESIAK